MKKLLVVMLVLSMATIANAGLKISVGGVIDPPDTSIILGPSQTVVLDVHSDGASLANEAYFLTIDGPGLMDVSAALNFVNSNAAGDTIIAVGDPIPGTMVFMDMAIVAVPPVPIPIGIVIDNIVFHCEGLGDVTITLSGTESGVFDTQVIHQIPEPMTMALLGLGGLFLRRRK